LKANKKVRPVRRVKGKRPMKAKENPEAAVRTARRISPTFIVCWETCVSLV